MRYDLTERIAKLANQNNIDGIFGWETVHRSDINRKRRKLVQLVIDQITFVLSGIISLIAFWILGNQITVVLWLLSIVEFLLLIGLGIEIIIYADLAKGR